MSASVTRSFVTIKFLLTLTFLNSKMNEDLNRKHDKLPFNRGGSENKLFDDNKLSVRPKAQTITV